MALLLTGSYWHLGDVSADCCFSNGNCGASQHTLILTQRLHSSPPLRRPSHCDFVPSLPHGTLPFPFFSHCFLCDIFYLEPRCLILVPTFWYSTSSLPFHWKRTFSFHWKLDDIHRYCPLAWRAMRRQNTCSIPARSTQNTAQVIPRHARAAPTWSAHLAHSHS